LRCDRVRSVTRLSADISVRLLTMCLL
jgi:hypothetical protein